MRTLYTIGHSSHTLEHFQALLREHGIEVLVDTRSYPYSKRVPHFDREELPELAAASGSRYLYLGDVVGGRPKERAHYDGHGRVLYSKVAGSPEFLAGIGRLERGADKYRVALLCSEEDPAHCHRRLLIGRVLMERGARLLHIRGHGELQDDAAVAAASGKLLAETQPALFAEIDEARWRSTASVLPKGPLGSSSAR
jgi:uncharacterized protein (DUF488 family)